MNKQNTPLPWKHGKPLDDVTFISGSGPNAYNFEVRTCDANFIIKSCNYHYELLEAIEHTLEIIEEHLDDGEYDQWLHLLSKKLKETLNKVRGE